MSEPYHAVVWIDHREARIFLFDRVEVNPVVVAANASAHHLEHRANIKGASHRGVDREFFEQVIRSLRDVGAILITGPGNARLELKNYLAEHHADLAKRVSAVEALDHPSDTALLALARKFFKADDRMHRPPA
jgi:stalled ribosome rescue protein Dom34